MDRDDPGSYTACKPRYDEKLFREDELEERRMIKALGHVRTRFMMDDG